MYYSVDIGNILKDGILFFNDKCNIKFNLLKKFDFVINDEINHDAFNNLCNNINNMPNLKYFRLQCDIGGINENIYKNFIVKLLSLKLDYIILSVKKIKNFLWVSRLHDIDFKEKKDIYYTNEELIQIFPGIKDIEDKEYYIQKIDLITY